MAASCRGWKRSGLVTREYASSSGPSVPHLSPRMSLPPARISRLPFVAGSILVEPRGFGPRCKTAHSWHAFPQYFPRSGSYGDVTPASPPCSTIPVVASIPTISAILPFSYYGANSDAALS